MDIVMRLHKAQQWSARLLLLALTFFYPIMSAAQETDMKSRIHPGMNYLITITADDMFVVPYVNGAPLFRHLRLQNVLTTVDVTGELKPGKNEIAINFEPFDKQARAFTPHEGVKLQVKISRSSNPLVSPRVEEEISLFSGRYDAQIGEIVPSDQSVYSQGPVVQQDGNLRASGKYLLEPVVMEYTDGNSREYARRLVLNFDIDDIPMPTPPWTDATPLQDTPELRRELAEAYAKLHRAITAGDVEEIAKVGDVMLTHEADVLGYDTPLEVASKIDSARPWAERDGARLAPLPANWGGPGTRLEFAAGDRLVSGWDSPLDYVRSDGTSIGQLVYWFCRPDGKELVACYSQDVRY